MEAKLMVAGIDVHKKMLAVVWWTTSIRTGSNVENRTVTLQQAVERLGVSELSVRRLIEQKVLPATQVPSAPWEISLEALNAPVVQRAVENIRKRKRPPHEVTHYVVGSCGGLAIRLPRVTRARFMAAPYQRNPKPRRLAVFEF